MVCIALTNQKGGVGKTTSAVNLAAAFGKMNRRVLLIDMDPQGNATTGSGINKYDLTHSVYTLLMRQSSAEQAILSTEFGFDLLPANRDLAGAEIELAPMEKREWQLTQTLESLQKNAHYDLIFIDCPPSLSLLTINALCSAHHMLIPMQCEYYALEGLSDLMSTYKRLREQLGANISVLGLVLTMFDPRNLLAIQVQEKLLTYFGDKLLKTTIPRNVRLAESPSHGKPALFYDVKARGALAYMQCAEELNARLFAS